MAARTKSKVTPKYKTKYRVRNWAAYEESLRRRGDITVWFDADAVDSWNAPPSGRPGGQKEYSDVAIETALTLRSLFHFGLRQTEGFVGSLVRLMALELCVPDHTTLSRRGRTIDVRSLLRKGDGPLHLVIDSTGLKVVGGCVGVELLGRLGAPVESFRADGAYDTRAVYASLDEVGMPGIDIAIPPRRTASSSRPGGGA